MRIIYSILLLTFISGHLFAQRSETVQTNDSTFSVIKQLKEENLCDGVHIMAIGAEENVPLILDAAGL